jgi:hypothetical protein
MPVSITGTAQWPEGSAGSYGPDIAYSTPPDRHRNRLSYTRVANKATDVWLGSKRRVIIPHDGKSFAAPPL